MTTRRALCVIVALLATACGGGGGGTGSTSGAGSGGGALSDRELAYGLAAPQHPDGITYQPGVIVVDGGAAAIKAQSGDGVTWTIDGHAPHASELQVGSVMYMTGFAAGRVAALDHSGEDVVVTLAPVDVADIVRDGTLDAQQSLDPSRMVLRPMPELLNALEYTATGQPTPSPGTPDILPARALLTAASTMPPPTTGASSSVTVGPFELSMSRTANTITTKVAYTKDGVVLVASLSVELEPQPSAASHLQLSGGHVQQGRVRFSGVKSLTTNISLGSETGLRGNFKSQLEFPVELDVPVPMGPLPFNLGVQFKTILQTAVSARNSTVETSAKVDVTGPIGFDTVDGKTTVLSPEVAVSQPPIDNAHGTSIGVNGAVFAIQVRCLYGLGTAAASAGPFAALTISITATIGSDIGIVKCVQASLDVVASGGVGYKIAPLALKFFKDLIPESLKKSFKLETDFASVQQQLVHKAWAKPDVGACR